MEVTVTVPVTSEGTSVGPSKCPHCSNGDFFVIHYGPCPKVKAVEYYPDGTIKRIEYNGR